MEIDHPISLLAVIAGLVALGFWLESRFAWAKKVGATLLVILAGAAASNLHLVAFESPVYEAISGPVTLLAIVWLLFAVPLRALKKAGPEMLGMFTMAVVATALGAMAGCLFFSSLIGPDSWKLGGVLVGTYSGGSLNFVGVAQGLEEQGHAIAPDLLAASMAADNGVTAIWFAATLLLPG